MGRPTELCLSCCMFACCIWASCGCFGLFRRSISIQCRWACPYREGIEGAQTGHTVGTASARRRAPKRPYCLHSSCRALLLFWTSCFQVIRLTSVWVPLFAFSIVLTHTRQQPDHEPVSPASLNRVSCLCNPSLCCANHSPVQSSGRFQTRHVASCRSA